MKQSDDTLLEDYLAGDSPISKQYANDHELNIPESMDDAILSAARFSVRAKSQPLQRIKSMINRWQVPLSIAAVTLVSMSLVLTMYDEYGQGYLDAPVSESVDTDKVEAKSKQESNPVQQVDEFAVSSDILMEEETVLSTPAQQEETESDSMAIDSQSLEPSAASPAPVISERDQTMVRQQQMEALQKDVEELKRTQSELLEERAALKQSINDIESKTSQLKNKLDDSKQPELTDTSIANELLDIIQLWQQDENDKAIDMLNDYREQHPEISDEQLQKMLPDDFWKRFSKP